MEYSHNAGTKHVYMHRIVLATLLPLLSQRKRLPVYIPEMAPPTPVKPIAPSPELENGDSRGARDMEAVAQLNDSVLLGHRTWPESIVLCLANLIPPLGVA